MKALTLLRGILLPSKAVSKKKIQEHSFFGMLEDETESVDEIMDFLRN